MEKIPVIIDCDTGTDDAIALIMACALEKLRVIAVTTVAGNQTVDKTTYNTLKVLSFLGVKNIPVSKGATKPLTRTLKTASYVHGETGLGGVILPDPAIKAQAENAVSFMYRLLRQSSEAITLVCIAPLTNIALLLSCHPDIISHIKRIVLMGGGIKRGNITANAEFNIYVDPEAASIVFNSGVPITMCPLDMTEKAVIKFSEIEALATARGKISQLATDILTFSSKYYRSKGFDGVILHDPAAVSYIAHPEWFSTVNMRIAIETKGEITTGATCADLRQGETSERPNVCVCTGIDREKFVSLVAACCKSYDTGTLV